MHYQSVQVAMVCIEYPFNPKRELECQMKRVSDSTLIENGNF